MAEGLVILTGASGFVGSALLDLLRSRSREVRPIVRQERGLAGAVAVGEIGLSTEWSKALQGADSVVHLAARVHVMDERSSDPLAEFRKVNVEGTLHLAREAVVHGVRRFVYISSLKVNGEASRPGVPFTADDVPAPSDPYSISKHEAEQGLLALARETGLEVVIIRPPLVYGAGVKANFLRMMRWLYRGVPLPFGAIVNRRSLVALDNLIDLIVVCIDHPAAINQIFLVGDGEDLSTTELLKHIAAALGKPARLLPIPQNIFKIGLKLVGKGDVAQRLCSSLSADISKARTLLGWIPPVGVDEALRKTARHFLDSNRRSDP